MLTVRHGWLPALLTIALLGLVSCESQHKVSDRDIKPIDSKELKSLLSKPKAKVLLIDSRTRQQYEAGHIPGAVNIKVQDARGNDPRLAQAKTIVVYGQDWLDDVPRVMAKRLHVFGYSGVLFYTQGYEGYQRDIAAAGS